MNYNDFGLPEDNRVAEAGIAKRRMTSALMEATHAEPPHLVDVQVVNDQNVGIWYTLEPFNELGDVALSGWDVSRRKFATFTWDRIIGLRSNSLNYTRATSIEWERRQRATNMQWDEDKKVIQSVGVFWRGKRTPPKRVRRIVI